MKKTDHIRKDLLSFSVPLFWIILFVFLTWIIHLSLISGISFFHFSLDHSLSIIENWVEYHGWELIILSKILALLIFNRLFFLGEESNKIFKEVKKNWHPPFRKTLLVSFQILWVPVIFGKVSFIGFINSDLRELALSFLCNGTEMFINILIVVTLIKRYAIKRSFLFWLIGSFTLSLSTFEIFSFVDYFSFYIFFSYSVIYFLFGKLFRNWCDVIFFIFFSISIYISFFGLDIVWGKLDGPFHSDHIFAWYESLTLFTIAILFLIRDKIFKKKIGG